MTWRNWTALWAVALVLLGLVLVAASITAWDGLPPDGPPLMDGDRLYEVFFGVLGALFVGGGLRLGLSAVRSRASH